MVNKKPMNAEFLVEKGENMEGITRDVKDVKQSIRNELIQRIKYCGQYIVDNAETILGEEKYIANLYLTCNFFDRSELPYVTVNKDIILDDFIEGR
jgi:hypothetical protein